MKEGRKGEDRERKKMATKKWDPGSQFIDEN